MQEESLLFPFLLTVQLTTQVPLPASDTCIAGSRLSHQIFQRVHFLDFIIPPIKGGGNVQKRIELKKKSQGPFR